MELLKSLNIEQKTAVTHGSGPLLIVAGAGTGKTTVITQRIAWLIDQKKAQSDEILALTFTDKASGEMVERVDQLLPYGYVDLWVSTFHAFGERVLRDYAIEVGLDSGFRLLSNADQWMLLKKHLDEFELKYYKPLGNPTRFIYALIQHFSRVKDEHVTAKEYLTYARKLNSRKNLKPDDKEDAEKILEVAKAYQQYQLLLQKNGYLDFGDLIIQTLELFKKRKKVLEQFRNKFKYILVDEFQDTNYAQYELIKLLAFPKNNITVVGDDDQAIYRFRGASMSNILEFKKDFPKSKEVVLINNYRSRQNILDLAYEFIQKNNPNRLEYQLKQVAVQKKNPKIKKVSKKLVSKINGDGIVKHIESDTQEDEVFNILREIEKIKKSDSKLTWNDFAILVRANSQADIFVNVFTNQEIPYQYVAARGLYQQPEILDMIAWLKMLDNYHESPSLFRVLSIDLFKISNSDLINLANQAKRKRISLYEVIESHQEVGGISQDTRKSLNYILDLIKKQTALAKEKSVGQICYEFLKAIGYLNKMSSKDAEGYHIKIQNISKFFRKVQDFERNNEDKSVKKFMEELELVIDVGNDPAPAQMEEGPESIKIMTVHGAKGLEFSYVFIANLVDKRFPSIERREQIEVPAKLIKEIIPEGDIHLQEERRLFYVACTRARKGLFFSSAKDVGGKTAKKPSRFLYEIDMVQGEKAEKSEQLNLGFTVVRKLIRQTEKIKYPLPKTFSYSQLKAYEKCPKQYKYMFIWRVPVLSGRHTYSFGTSVHNTLKAFYTSVKQGYKPTKTHLMKLYEENWIDDWYDSRQHMLERKKAGKLMLEEYFKTNKIIKTPVFLEKGFNLKIGEYSFRGFIDRVDSLDKDSVEIIDYKTGKKPARKTEIDHEQLMIYHIAMQEVFKMKPALLSLYFLDGNAKYSFTATVKDIEDLKAKIIESIKEIEKGDFTPAPTVYKCATCDFREICEDRAV
jgi:DNA helicase-2/ATP-dependent DNA helicase PcrA